MKVSYEILDNLKDIYLEDSYVLNIAETSSRIEFDIEFVLTEHHELYSGIKLGEQYCYLKGKMIFENVKTKTWIKRNKQFFTDSNCEIDFGNIDLFYIDKNKFYLQGDWGELKFISDNPKIVL